MIIRIKRLPISDKEHIPKDVLVYITEEAGEILGHEKTPDELISKGTLEILEKIRKVLPTAFIPAKQFTFEGKIRYRNETMTVEKALSKGIITETQKKKLDRCVEKLFHYSAIVSSRQKFEDLELAEKDVKVSNKTFEELMELFQFFKIPYKPIKNGIEVKYYPNEVFEQWKRDIGFKS